MKRPQKMAEIFLFTRGHHDHVDKFTRAMRSQFFPFKVKKKLKDSDGKEYEVEETKQFEAQLRPYQLWGYVVPEDMVEPVCNNLGIPSKQTYFNKEPESAVGEPDKNNSFISGKGIQAHLTALRLALGAKKLPDRDMTKGSWPVPIYRDHVNVLGIGWRSDKKGGTAIGEHELL